MIQRYKDVLKTQNKKKYFFRDFTTELSSSSFWLGLRQENNLLLASLISLQPPSLKGEQSAREQSGGIMPLCRCQWLAIAGGVSRRGPRILAVQANHRSPPAGPNLGQWTPKGYNLNFSILLSMVLLRWHVLQQPLHWSLWRTSPSQAVSLSLERPRLTLYFLWLSDSRRDITRQSRLWWQSQLKNCPDCLVARFPRARRSRWWRSRCWFVPLLALVGNRSGWWTGWTWSVGRPCQSSGSTLTGSD